MHWWFAAGGIGCTQQILFVSRLVFRARSANINKRATGASRNNSHLAACHQGDTIHGNDCCIAACAPSPFCLFLYLSLISNLHLTPSWGKASHSSTVFVPVTSRVPPAYQYQLRQCWACNLQLNVILLNPIWKLNIEKPLAYLPVLLPLSLPPLLAATIPAPHPCSCFAHWHLYCFVCVSVCVP